MTDTITLPRAVIAGALHALDLSQALLESAKSIHHTTVLEEYKSLRAALAQQADAKPKMVTPYVTQEQFDRVFPMAQQAKEVHFGTEAQRQAMLEKSLDEAQHDDRVKQLHTAPKSNPMKPEPVIRNMEPYLEPTDFTKAQMKQLADDRVAADLAQQSEPTPYNPLCELCVKRGYSECANTAKTTPIVVAQQAEQVQAGCKYPTCHSVDYQEELCKDLTAGRIAVPKGYQLVPIEPTKAIYKAVHTVFDNARKQGQWLPLVSEIHKAMLAAAAKESI